MEAASKVMLIFEAVSPLHYLRIPLTKKIHFFF